jgi:hypothetical protein
MRILEPGELEALAVSPLLNLGLVAPSATALIHHARLHGPAGTALPGEVSLRLSGGRLAVSASAVGAVRLARVLGTDGFVLCVLRGGERLPSGSTRFDLASAESCGFRLRRDSLRAFGLNPGAADAAMVDGISMAAPPRPASPAHADSAYLRGRLQAELGAALAAKRPKAASIHVALATLYARRLGTGEAALNGPGSGLP